MTDEQKIDEFENEGGSVEPTDEEIDDGSESKASDETVELGEQEVTDLNEVLAFFQSVLYAHEQAINAIAAAVFGIGEATDESQVPNDETVGSTGGDTESDGQVVVVDFGKSDSTDAS